VSVDEPSRLAGIRRLSQAIAEGDGISVIVVSPDLAAVRAAEEQGAEGLVLRHELEGVRDVTSLPLLWRGGGAPRGALDAGADAWCLAVADADDGEGVLERIQAHALELGLECVVEVREEDELALALERLDPEIFLLALHSDDDDRDPLDHVLSLLPDVPAGKLAIAEVPAESRDEVLALERAGIDGVIVTLPDVRELVGDGAPDV
jgi:alkanesulfonate monooxygenase SsuD/methylene tetrahydromethanopterin reductase-like flavin-dependent oxidoreductase (luciferase family)